MVLRKTEPPRYLTTYSGQQIDPLDPDPKKIFIEDIARALSHICRWNGQCRDFFSVGQHCIYVSYLCDPEDALIGLLHDAAEAYLGDMINPLKHMVSMQEYVDMEFRFEKAIAVGLGVPTILKTKSVEIADNLMLAKEAIELGREIPGRVMPLYRKWRNILEIMKWEILSPADTRKAYFRRYFELTRVG